MHAESRSGCFISERGYSIRTRQESGWVPGHQTAGSEEEYACPLPEMEITDGSVCHAVSLATQWRRVVLEKLMVPQPVNKLTACDRTRKFTTMFSATRKLPLSWARWILLASYFLRSIHIPCIVSMPSNNCLNFPHEIFYILFSSPYVLHAPPLSPSLI
jgi:hypothetical protein